jgi:hypothetical protein
MRHTISANFTNSRRQGGLFTIFACPCATYGVGKISGATSGALNASVATIAAERFQARSDTHPCPGEHERVPRGTKGLGGEDVHLPALRRDAAAVRPCAQHRVGKAVGVVAGDGRRHDAYRRRAIEAVACTGIDGPALGIEHAHDVQLVIDG